MRLSPLRKSLLKAAALFLFLCGCIAALYFIRQMSKIDGYAAEAKRLAAEWCLTKEEVYERFDEVESLGPPMPMDASAEDIETLLEIAETDGYEHLLARQQNPHVTTSFVYYGGRLGYVEAYLENDGFNILYYDGCKLREIVYIKDGMADRFSLRFYENGLKKEFMELSSVPGEATFFSGLAIEWNKDGSLESYQIVYPPVFAPIAFSMDK